MATHKLDVIGVCETFLGSSIFDSEVTPSSYTVYRADRNRYGGGLLIAVVNAFKVFAILIWNGWTLSCSGYRFFQEHRQFCLG